ncbi:MAG TPA: pantoate--beta-alanine ligase [Armatimonadetes bacterium]|jgi:pantoate--beta-alanine ligase|nr:pantoate--beta-alanine ligase [Armatimonadota bacterium]
MQILHTLDEMHKLVSAARRGGKSIGLVPTMGFFHAGHLSLMQQARKDNDLVVVSVFVNPTQFGPSEDFKTYPRDMDHDARLAESVGVDVIFNPSPEEMYPEGYSTYVEVERFSKGLCGASRPGHFRGVATVCLKLMNITGPDRAYFGMKDYQQLRVVQRMAADLNLCVQIVPMPIFREPDGLAMSSRNTYLNPAERRAALILKKALEYAQRLIDEGVTSADELRIRVVEFISTEPLAQIDYVEAVDPDTLDCIKTLDHNAVLALAVKIGNTRLIDNTILKV